jgi:hypothetical protein
MQPLKNFPAFYGTRKFNTVFTRAPLVPIRSHIPIHIALLLVHFFHYVQLGIRVYSDTPRSDEVNDRILA